MPAPGTSGAAAPDLNEVKEEVSFLSLHWLSAAWKCLLSSLMAALY